MSNYRQEHFVDRTQVLSGFERILGGDIDQVVLAIEGRARMGKSWLALKLSGLCAASSDSPPLFYVNYENPSQIHDIQQLRSLPVYLRYKIGDQGEDESLFTSFDEALARAAGGTSARPGLVQGPTAPSALVTLANRLAERCEDEHLEEICGLLDLWFENYLGSTRQRRTYELAMEIYRSGRLEEFLESVEGVHPDRTIDWRAGLEPLLSREDAPSAFLRRATPLGSDEQIANERMINDAFFRCLHRLVEQRGSAVFILDTLERDEIVLEGAREWLTVQLLGRIADQRLPNVHVVLLGRDLPDMRAFGLGDTLKEWKLKGFSRADIETYWRERRAIPLPGDLLPDDYFAILEDTSGGNPGLLAEMADNKLEKLTPQDPFFSDDHRDS